MTARVKPYVKVRRGDVDEMADNPRLLGAWVRLLILADGAWPMAAQVPRWCGPKLRARLGDRIEVVGSQYRVPAVDTDRARAKGGR